MADTRSQPCLGYPSKSAAAIALHAEGFNSVEIAEKTGSTAAAVRMALKAARRRGQIEAKTADTPAAPTWTPEKREKARRLFNATMGYIAEALNVPLDELLQLVRPPARALEISGPDDAQVVLLVSPLPDHSPDVGEKVEVLPEAPSRDDDEAELARLAAEAEAEGDEAIEGDAMLVDEPDQVSVDRDIEEQEQTELPPAPMFYPDRIGTADPDLPPLPAPIDAAVQEMAPGPKPPPTGLFWLVDAAGRYLKENTLGLTDKPGLAWEGTEAQIKALMQRKPHYKHLEAVAI